MSKSPFSPEIEKLYELGVWGSPCPVGEMMAETDEQFRCPTPTCPVCNYCFKYHHPNDRHAKSGELID